MDKVIIGFFTYSGDNALCEGKALVVINQKKIMKNFVQGVYSHDVDHSFSSMLITYSHPY